MTDTEIAEARQRARSDVRDAVIAWRDAPTSESWGHFVGRGEHMDKLLERLVALERACAVADEGCYREWYDDGSCFGDDGTFSGLLASGNEPCPSCAATAERDRLAQLILTEHLVVKEGKV